MIIKNSSSFRWKRYKNRRALQKIENSKNKHNKRINKIRASNFTIISSNCWGGSVYEDLKLQYLTPTVGLFFYAPCFIRMLGDLKRYMNETPVFINQSKYPEANQFRNENFTYPIGLLGGDVEIQFLHYKTEEEALEKWERRKKRIAWDNLYISCTDRDRMDEALIKEFDKLHYQKKVFFTAKKCSGIKSAVQLMAYAKNKEVGDLYNERYRVSIDFDIKKWIEAN